MKKTEKKETHKKASFGNTLTMSENFRRYKCIYLMLVPVLLYYIIFKYIPLGGLIISFQDYKPLKGFLESDFVGFKHFIDFLTGPYSVRTITNTLMISVYQLIFGFPAPIILALLLNEIKYEKFKSINQTISYLPHFVSAVVVAGLLIDFVKSDGIITTVVCKLTGMEPMSLLSKPEFFRPLYVSMTMWQQMGWSSIIYLATLSNADPTLYEAASLDGAGRFRKIWHITIPVLVPIITIQLIMRMGQMMTQGFETVLLLQNPLTYDTSDIVSTYVYRRGLGNMEYSFATAVDLFNSIVNIILLCSANWFSKKVSEESLW